MAKAKEEKKARRRAKRKCRRRPLPQSRMGIVGRGGAPHVFFCQQKSVRQSAANHPACCKPLRPLVLYALNARYAYLHVNTPRCWCRRCVGGALRRQETSSAGSWRPSSASSAPLMPRPTARLPLLIVSWRKSDDRSLVLWHALRVLLLERCTAPWACAPAHCSYTKKPRSARCAEGRARAAFGPSNQQHQ